MADFDDLSGRRFGRYELRQLLGEGGMGVVYLADDTGLGRPVAVKILSPKLTSESTNVQRFLREAKIAAKLHHPHIVTVHDHGEHDGFYYIVMHYVRGHTLDFRLKERGNLSLEESAGLLAQLASALDYAHGEGVIHRDVKGRNVLYDHRDNPFLADFGIAKLTASDSSITEPGIAIGTRSHMAPEQWKGEELTPATDQYALGITLYAALTGRMPFEADDAHVLMTKHLTQLPPPPQQFRPDLPDTLEPVFEIALAKSPSKRYPSAWAFADAFKQAVQEAANRSPNPRPEKTPVAVPLDEDTTPAPVPTPVPDPPTGQHVKSRKKLRFVLASLLVIALLLGADYALTLLGILPLGGASEGQTQTAIAVLQIATESLTPSSTPTASPTPTATQTPSPTPSLTFTPTLTPTETPTLSATDIELTVQAGVVIELTGIQKTAEVDGTATKLAESAVIEGTATALTATATMWTDTPTPDISATIIARMTLTQDAINFQATHDAFAAATQYVLDQTATVMAWTATPTASHTPTATNTPSATPTATAAVTCSGSPLSRLAAGGYGRVIEGLPPNSIREAPGTVSDEVGEIPGGETFIVLDGPVCGPSIGRAWWRVEYNGIVGWTAEGEDDTYWLEPVLLPTATVSFILTQAVRVQLPTQVIADSLDSDTQIKEHTFFALAGQPVTITLVSPDFDSFLTLRYPDGSEVLNDDVNTRSLNARVGPLLLTLDGMYTIVVSSKDGRLGDYTLTITSYSECGDTPFAIPLQDSVRLREHPDANAKVPYLANSDECLPIVGRSQDSEWLKVRVTAGQMLWVRASDVLVVGNFEDVPVMNE